ncbi:MAG TPA: hypothetical protein VLB68_23645 [Pyrinomonadaceae bacterium]|nr:hypothetical protein [Pyrinomonadaceae bacterium]
MKTLFLKSVLMLVPLFSLLGLVELRLRYVPNEYSSNKARLEAKAGEIEILVTGTSHAQNGVAPEFLALPTFNLGYGSQSLHYDTQLVSKYVDSMPNLKLVIFGLSYHSLEYRLVNSVERWRGGFYHLVYGIPGEDSQEEFKLTNYSYIALYTPKEAVRLASGGILGAAEEEARRIQTPTVVTHGEVSEAFGKVRITSHEKQMRPVDLPANVAALERTCAMLKQRNVSVVFITVPTHHTYYDHINPQSYQRMQDTIKQMTGKFGVPYFNYLRDERFATEDFINSDHLNSRGAEKFSRILNEDVVKRYVLR